MSGISAGPPSCRYDDSFSIKHAHIRKSSEDKLPGFRNKIEHHALEMTLMGDLYSWRQISHQCHLKSMVFDFIYGFDILEQSETCLFQGF